MLRAHSRETLEKARLLKMNDGSTRLHGEKDALRMQPSRKQYDKLLNTQRSREYQKMSFLNANYLVSQSLSTFLKCKYRC